MQGENHQRNDLKRESGEQGLVESSPGTDPPAEQVGDDPHEFVEQEEKGERHRRVPEVVEVEQYQQAQGSIGDRERPVARSDKGVVAQLHDGFLELRSDPCGQVGHPERVAVLVVVPGEDFHHPVIDHHCRGSVDDARSGVVHEVG